jgi:hypothetical protein
MPTKKQNKVTHENDATSHKDTIYHLVSSAAADIFVLQRKHRLLSVYLYAIVGMGQE